jgi:hypothetical protein
VITVELVRLTRNGQRRDAEFAVRIHADGTVVSIEGLEPELVDLTQPVLHLRDGMTITCADDPEEWVRGLAASFRTPYLSARVVDDTDPLPVIEIAAADVEEPVLR